jgi:hypothetical protein
MVLLLVYIHHCQRTDSNLSDLIGHINVRVLLLPFALTVLIVDSRIYSSLANLTASIHIFPEPVIEDN